MNYFLKASLKHVLIESKTNLQKQKNKLTAIESLIPSIRSHLLSIGPPLTFLLNLEFLVDFHFPVDPFLISASGSFGYGVPSVFIHTIALKIGCISEISSMLFSF
ncbi:unnamed protein product [Citrullus colocynthis]|uniref:Uncharacterized protein n=1 Tax=Citrullus colocynthis TaxID=252529 RepID=A0ABP0XYA0_9ROSI